MSRWHFWFVIGAGAIRFSTISDIILEGLYDS